MKFYSLLLICILMCISSCFYDVEEKLYPNPAPCEIITVSFSQELAVMIDNYCQSCHIQGVAQGGVILDNYDDFMVQVNNGKLLSAISRDGKNALMPPLPNEAVPACDVEKLKVWIANGARNN